MTTAPYRDAVHPSVTAGASVPRRAVRVSTILFFLALFHAGADASHREQAKQQLAIRAAAREVLDALPALTTTNATDAPILIEDLHRMMTTHVEHHVSIEEAKTASRIRLKHARLRTIEELLDQAATHAHEQSPLTVTRQDVISRLGAPWEAKEEETIDRFLDQSLDPLFREARARAVRTQKNALKQSVHYPTFEQLDPKLTAMAPTSEQAKAPLSPKAFQTLQAWIQTNAFTQVQVFEENLPIVRQLGEHVLSEIQRQYTHQADAVRHPVESGGVPSNAILQSTIEAFLLSALAQVTSELECPASAPRYAIFTAVRNYTTHEAREVRDTRLLAYIARPNAITLDASELQRQMEEAPENHRAAAQSHKLFLERLVAEMHRPFAEGYAAVSETPAVNQIDLLLLDEPRIAKAFRDLIDRLLKEKLPPLRAELSQKQFETIFPALQQGVPFPDNVIEFLHDVQTPRIANMGLLREVLALEPTLTPLAHQPNTLLVETEKLAMDAANTQAEPLVRALGAQLRLLASIADENREQLRLDVIADKSFEDIKSAWSTELEQRWKQSGSEVPERARALFARTQDELDKTVRQLYDTVREELAIEKQAATTEAAAADGDKISSPESEKVDVQEEPPDEDEEEQIQKMLAGMEEELLACRGIADFVFILSDGPNETGLVVFGHPAHGMVTNTRFSPSEVEDAAAKIAQAVGDNFTTVLQARADASRGPKLFFWRNHTPLLRILVLEHSRQMRHLSSILLQQKIRERIEQWAKARDVRFRLDWQESPGQRDGQDR